MKCLISGTSLEKVPKRLSNNSMRKTTVKKLKATGVAESTIVKANGHTSTAGLRSYGPSDQGELRGMSNAIDSSLVSLQIPLNLLLVPASHLLPLTIGEITFFITARVTFNNSKVTQSVTNRKRKLVIYSEESSQSQ